MLLLDTSVLIEIQDLVLPPEPLAISTISYGELRFGIELSSDLDIRRARQAQLARIASFGLAWRPFDELAAEAYGTIAAHIAQTRPRHARSKDAMMTGHAYSLGAGILTLNPHDFESARKFIPVLVPARR